MVTVLGIRVSPALLKRWAGWLAPDPQPFFVESPDDWPGRLGAWDELSQELISTYQLWGIPHSAQIVWISASDFAALPRRRRAELVRAQVTAGRAVPTVRAWRGVLDGAVLHEQADGHRFVWWPELLEGIGPHVLASVVSRDRLPSRHNEVRAETWRRCARVLPQAQELAGTFVEAGGPHCFSTVMAAAGLPDSTPWETTEPFDEWLRVSAVSTGRGSSIDLDRRIGTVYVWRTLDGTSFHAAVGIGDGWALEKPSVDWHSPRAIVSVPDLIRSNTYRGQRLSRYRLLG